MFCDLIMPWILWVPYHVQVYGVKGPCCLATVPCFDIIGGMSADYMHCVLLGVTRMLLRLWFNSSHHSEIWYIGTAVKVVDSRLSCILPPSEIQRTPRSIEKTMKYWKGKCCSLLINFCLYKQAMSIVFIQ